MTAVVLAGGRGRRLQASDPSALVTDAERHAAASGLKVLMPVGGAGTPLLAFVLTRLAAAGVSHVVLVVPPVHDAIAGFLQATPPPVPVQVAMQPVPNGTAGAVVAAAPFVPAAGCLVVNGDNLYPVDAIRALVALDGPGLGAFTCASLERESGFSPARVAAFARVEAAGGWLTALEEKPAVARLDPESLISMNLWRFDAALVAACHDVAPSPRGELEIPDAVALALARGSRVRVVPVAGAVLDLTVASDVAGLRLALGPRAS